MQTRTWITAAIAIAALALAAACGGDSGGNGSARPGTFGGGQPSGGTSGGSGKSDASSGSGANASGSCEVKISGDQTLTVKGGGGAGSVGSDYWLSDDDLRTALTTIEKIGNKGSDADVKKKRTEHHEIRHVRDRGNPQVRRHRGLRRRDAEEDHGGRELRLRLPGRLQVQAVAGREAFPPRL